VDRKMNPIIVMMGLTTKKRTPYIRLRRIKIRGLNILTEDYKNVEKFLLILKIR